MTPSSLRAWIDQFRFRLRLAGRSTLDIGLAGLGVVLLPAPLFVAIATLSWRDIGMADALGGAGTVFGVWLLARDLRRRARARRTVGVQANPQFRSTVARLEPQRFHGRSWMVDDAINAALRRPFTDETRDRPATTLKPDTTRYEVPDQLAEYRLRCVHEKNKAFNEAKVRLIDDPGGTSVRIQRTDYFSGLATNEMATDQFVYLHANRTRTPSLLCAVADLFIVDDRLLPLADSPFSNHIGVTTLLLTADDQLILQEQGDQVVDRGRVSLGGSESLDWADAFVRPDVPRTLEDMVAVAMRREATQEVGALFAAHGGTMLTGYARYLDRGGKPEFFGISRSLSTFQDIEESKASDPYVHHVYKKPFGHGRAGLIAAIVTLLEEGDDPHNRHSLSMVVALRMAKECLELSKPGNLTMIGIDD